MEVIMNKETVSALITAAAVVAVNLMAYFFGVTVDIGDMSAIIGGAVTISVSIAACWHNFNFTAAAQVAQGITDELKLAAKIEQQRGGADND